MMPEAVRFNTLIEDLRGHGWCQLVDFLPGPLAGRLAAECLRMDRAAMLRPAATGRSAHRSQGVLRGDRTHWFDEQNLSHAQCELWEALDAVRQTLNRELLLGLASLEAHYAIYPPGAAYVRHVDRFSDDDARVVSCVLYLNDGWSADCGGALRLHLDDGAIDILPHSGTLVLFLSAEIEHEVLPATRERLSIAGWFRRRPLQR
ncbi:MAG: 2OG-Fe(II) oxygenase [Tahibacter sp.]